ncbi:MAG: sulfotransferase domain-containing protein [Lachnospiraceae bacterium]|nr:sulfotransferase domain-containing protein [Lachnospiraceae bacterium]
MEPSFICIGFQKCGTTSLYDLLKKNKNVYLTEDVKEPMFYRVPFMRAFLGRKWYCHRYFGHYVEAVLGKTDNACEVGLITGRRGHVESPESGSAACCSKDENDTDSQDLSSCAKAEADCCPGETSAKFESPATASHRQSQTGRHRLIAGEVNAGLGYKNCTKWIGKDFAPNTKLIFMMRDPADRCYSAYKYFLALGFLPVSAVAYDLKHGHAKGFDHYVRSVLCHKDRRRDIMKKHFKYMCFSQGNYATLIKEYLRYFPRSNMKFVFFEDFVTDQEAVTKDIMHFCGIPEDDHMVFPVKSNETNFRAIAPLSPKYLQFMQALYYLFFEFWSLGRRCPSFFNGFMSFYDWSMEHFTRPDTGSEKMLPETRKLLNRYYRRQIEQVEDITGRKAPARWARTE